MRAAVLSLLTLVVAAGAAPTSSAASPVMVASSFLSDGGSFDGARLAVDARGNTTAVFAKTLSDGTGTYAGTTLWVADKAIGATEYEPARRLGTEHPSNASTWASAWQVAVAPDGAASVAWIEGHAEGQARELWVADRAAGASDFAKAVRVDEVTDNPGQISLTRSGDGTTLVWLSQRDYTESAGWVGTIRASVRPAGAMTFPAAADVSPAGPIREFALSAAPDGGVAVGWLRVGPATQSPAIAGTVEAHVARKAPGAASFGIDVQLSDPSQRALDQPLHVAQAVGNATTVTWDVEGESRLNPGSGVRIDLSRTLRPDGAITATCPVLPSETSDNFSPRITAMESDAAGNVTAIWRRGDALSAATQRAGQPCFDASSTVASGFVDSAIATLGADGRGGLFLMSNGAADQDATGRQVGYRPPIGDATGASIPAFAAVTGFNAGSAASITVDSFGHGQFAYSDRWGRVGSAVVDRAPPVLSAVMQPGPAIAGQPTQLSVTATDVYSPPVTLQWAFSDGSTATGASVIRTFRGGSTPSGAVTAIDAAGNSVTRTVAIRQEPPLSPPSSIGRPKAPTLMVALRGGAFRPASETNAGVDGGAVKGSRGAALSVTTSAAGKLRFTLARYTQGHRVGKRCRPKAPRRHQKLCSLRTAATGAVTVDVVAGKSTLRLTGRWERRALPPGRYRLSAQLTSGEKSPSAAIDFRIKRPTT